MTGVEAPESIPDDGIVLVTQWNSGRDIYPSHILTPEQAHERFYFRVTRQSGKTVKVENMSPKGRVLSYSDFEHARDGSMKVRVHDGHGVETVTGETAASGRETRTLRSGASSTRGGCTSAQHRFDAKGRILETLCLDPSGNPQANTDGCEMMRYVVDVHGARVRSACHNANGDPILDKGGIHADQTKLDALGFDLEHTFVDTSGVPTARATDGCWGWKNTYDRLGSRVRGTCLDARRQPTHLKGAGHASIVSFFDDNGCLTRNRWLDSRGERTSARGIFERVMERNEACDTLSNEQRDVNGRLAAGDRLSTPSTTSTFDAEGNEIEQKCFDVSGDPVACRAATRGESPTFGVIMRRTFDNQGRLRSEKSFDKSGAPSRTSAGYPHEEQTAWDERGHKTEETFFDEKGRPALALGAARFEYVFDAMGFLVSEKLFGLKNEPVVNNLGYHEIRALYDLQHRQVRIELHGLDGNFIETVGMQYGGVSWPKGAALVTIERGTTVVNTFLDKNSKPLQRIDCTRVETHCYR